VIEERLLDAAEGWFPPTPPVAERARRRLQGRTDPVRRLPVRWLVIGVAASVLVGGAVAATLLDALPGVRLRHVERLPSVALAEPLDAGRPVSLADARRTMPFRLLLPTGVSESARYYLDHDFGGNAVFTAVYGDGGLVLTEWRAGPVLFDKLLDYRARTEYVDVDGDPGMWVEGTEHAVFYLGLSGREHRLAGRLAGNVLVWQRNRNAVTYRLEADVERERALELAASLRPK
jgi:hypothetical protein